MLLAQSPSDSQRWFVALVTFALAALAAASATFWLLHWPTPAAPAALAIGTSASAAADSSKVAQLLGDHGTLTSPGAVVATTSRYKLLGVIAQGGQGHRGVRGSALIAIDGAPAKPYRVGDTVADALVLQAVEQRRAVLAPADDANAALTLELPLLPGMSARP